MGNKPAGYRFYNDDAKVFQYCDGTNWIAMNVPGTGSGGCTTVTMGNQLEGKIFYNGDFRVLQGCAGNVWRAMGPIGGVPSDPFADIQAGYNFTCGLKGDGTLWCWGFASYDQTAHGTGEFIQQQYEILQVADPDPWASFSAGYWHACGIKTDGSAWCWGRNTQGEVGNGNTSKQAVPVQITESGPWDMIVAGSDGQTTCGIKTDGSAWCWGDGNAGQLGNGETIDYSSAQQVTEAGPWQRITPGGGHTCGIKTDGTLWCWGSDGFGRLGCGGCGQQLSPVQVSEPGPWESVEAHEFHTCAKKTDGTAWCWGLERAEEFGNGPPGGQNVPEQVSDAGPWDIITTGHSHSCGIKDDNTAWCWGSNASGQLGTDGGTQDVPVQISEPGPWIKISADENHTCAIKDDNSSYCWGNDDYGQLGTQYGPEPKQVNDSGPWDAIYAGDLHTCGVKTDGSVWCWGSDFAGALGNGSAVTISQTSPYPISDAGPWNKINTNHRHTCVVKSSDGTLWCWGEGSSGQLGNGDTADQDSPVQVTDVGPWSMVNVSQDHSCGIKTDGTAWCWGLGTSGQLGNGDTISYSSAQQVTEAGPWDTVALARFTTCAIKTDGTLWCWGSDSHGKLGCGGCGNQSNPVQISEPGPWKTVTGASAFDHFCAIKDDGTAWCWGRDNNGQLGNGAGTSSQSSPVQITEAGPWETIEAGFDHTCATKTNGTLWCWGSNSGGKLAISTTSGSQQDPVQVADTGPWSMTSAGSGHSCGVKTDGTGWCWGSRGGGKLGIGDGFAKHDAGGVGGNCGVGVNETPEGQLVYNADFNIMQYCAGAGFVGIGK